MASLFWVPLAVTAVVAGTGGGGTNPRLTVGSTTGLLAGDVVIIAGVTGATGVNGTQTVSLIVDTTHFEITGTFGGTYVSGGIVGGGRWTSTSTANWATSTGGTAGGGGPPAAADTVTFDASSGGGTVIIAATINGTNTVSSIVSGVFTGTLDFNANTPTITVTTSWNNGGAGTRTITLGASTWNMTGTSGTVWDFTGSNLTLTANTATINVNATLTAARVVSLGTGKVYGGTVSITNGQTPGATIFQTTIASTSTVANLTFNGPIYINFSSGTTTTVSTSFSANGTQANQLFLQSNIGLGATLALPASTTLSWVSILGMTFTGSPVANNSFGYGSGITINPPAGGSAHIIGGS